MIMTKEDIIKDMENELRRADNAYYNSNTPIMSDEEYDKLVIRYKKLSKKQWVPKVKPAGNKKIVNTVHGFENLLGTIDNKFQNMDDIKEWLKSIYETAKVKELSFLVTEKYDGNSLAIEYENGKCKVALTRGEDGKGADMTDIFKDQELKVKDENYIGIRYEVMLTYEDFNKLNELRVTNNENTYANPRNTVAGLLARTDAVKYKDYLTLVPLSLRIKGKELTRDEELELIEKYQNIKDIDLNGNLIEGTYTQVVQALEEMYNEYIPKREELNYMIDGLVIEIIDQNLKDSLGRFATGSPKWSAALKFPYMEKTSTVTDIVFEVSPNGTGKITPSVIYEPVYFNGAKMQKTSLANYKRFKELNLGIGSKIMVEYHNDVLCYVTKLDDDVNKDITPFEFIKTCPVCGGKVVVNENQTFAYCSSNNCPSKSIGKINNYASSVGMKGIEFETLRKIYEYGLIKTPADLYRLRVKILRNIPGLGDASAENIVETIQTNQPNDYQLLAGLGIANFGEDAAKRVLDEFSIETLADKEYVLSEDFSNRLKSIENIGPVMSERIPKELANLNDLIIDLLANARYKSTKRVKLDNQLIFVHTGDTNKEYFKDRGELKAYIESCGHKMTGSVSKKTNYLITETPNSGTIKNKKAQELGIKIITCEQLKELLG